MAEPMTPQQLEHGEWVLCDDGRPRQWCIATECEHGGGPSSVMFRLWNRDEGHEELSTIGYPPGQIAVSMSTIQEVAQLRADLAQARQRIDAIQRLISPEAQMAAFPFGDGERWFREDDIAQALTGDGPDAP